MTGERFGGRESGMDQTQTKYAGAGEVNIAYQVVGDGPVDLVWAYGLASNIEVFWEEPSFAAFFRRLSEFSRLILFDRRGCGASDREGTTVTPTLEERMDDVIAVLDALGSERASIFGVSEGGALAALFAATHPERTSSIIVYGTMARFLKDADHPWGWANDDGLASFNKAVEQGWGTIEGAEGGVPLWAPSMVGDERFTNWMARYMRQSVSRGAISPLLWSFPAYDLVDVFPAVRVPTLVLHRREDLLVPVSMVGGSPSRFPTRASSSSRGSTISLSSVTRTRSWPRWRTSSSDRVVRRLATGSSSPWPSPISPTPRPS